MTGLGQFEEQGGDRKGELLKNCQKTMLLCKKIMTFFASQLTREKNPWKFFQKPLFFPVREGVYSKIFSNPSIGWYENGFWEGNLLRGKSAYGYPPLPMYVCDLPMQAVPSLLEEYSRDTDMLRKAFVRTVRG